MPPRNVSGMDRQATATNEFGTHLLDTPQAAKKLGLCARTLECWRLRGIGPKYIRMSPRAVRYRPRELARWVSERDRKSVV